MRKALLNLATIIAMQHTRDDTTATLITAANAESPNDGTTTNASATNLQLTTFPFAIPSSAGSSAAATKVSPAVLAPPLIPQNIQQMVENIVSRRESKRGRVLTYNQLYAFVEDPQNTLLLLTPSTL